MEQNNTGKTGLLNSTLLVIKEITNVVRVKFVDTVGVIVGTITNPFYTVNISPSGGTPTTNVNMHDGAGTAINSTGNALHVKEASPLTNYALETTGNLAALAALIAAGRLKVNADGTITANAGTNLNTSALALEAGGNLAAIVSALASQATAALQGTGNNTTADIKLELQKLNSLVPAVWDYALSSYTGDNMTGIVFKVGGAGGTTVSTLTLTYTGTDKFESVTKT